MFEVTIIILCGVCLIRMYVPKKRIELIRPPQPTGDKVLREDIGKFQIIEPRLCNRVVPGVTQVDKGPWRCSVIMPIPGGAL